jgi:hypothetical protein
MQTAIDRVMKTGLADNLKAPALMVLEAVQRNGPSLGGATGAVFGNCAGAARHELKNAEAPPGFLSVG